MGDLGSISGWGRSPGEGKGYPFQYSGLESSMNCIVHEVAKRWTGLTGFHFHLHIITFHSAQPLGGTVPVPRKDADGFMKG